MSPEQDEVGQQHDQDEDKSADGAHHSGDGHEAQTGHPDGDRAAEQDHLAVKA